MERVCSKEDRLGEVMTTADFLSSKNLLSIDTNSSSGCGRGGGGGGGDGAGGGVGNFGDSAVV